MSFVTLIVLVVIMIASCAQIENVMQKNRGTGECICADIPPDADAECLDLARLSNWCKLAWVVESSFCQLSCHRCTNCPSPIHQNNTPDNNSALAQNQTDLNRKILNLSFQNINGQKKNYSLFSLLDDYEKWNTLMEYQLNYTDQNTRATDLQLGKQFFKLYKTKSGGHSDHSNKNSINSKEYNTVSILQKNQSIILNQNSTLKDINKIQYDMYNINNDKVISTLVQLKSSNQKSKGQNNKKTGRHQNYQLSNLEVFKNTTENESINNYKKPLTTNSSEMQFFTASDISQKDCDKDTFDLYCYIKNHKANSPTNILLSIIIFGIQITAVSYCICKSGCCQQGNQSERQNSYQLQNNQNYQQLPQQDSSNFYLRQSNHTQQYQQPTQRIVFESNEQYRQQQQQFNPNVQNQTFWTSDQIQNRQTPQNSYSYQNQASVSTLNNIAVNRGHQNTQIQLQNGIQTSASEQYNFSGNGADTTEPEHSPRQTPSRVISQGQPRNKKSSANFSRVSMLLSDLPYASFAECMKQGDCGICLVGLCEEFEEGDRAIVLPCFHVFHKNCIKAWIEAKRGVAKCPLCQSKLCQQQF
eukprot:TRINITY_DN24066_c0_g1_i16.p1 TRINITY_DN24066_c0_g1~~TRINITY_DN24066_c0_g1_i16.p1  ORF type:complete len:585 (-),score=25.65 TRINITY_DN24066_c0_g1_i16:1002-2756(-)